MILDKEMLVPLYGMNIKYYENLGYKIPKEQVKGHKNRMVVPKGTKIFVKIDDLQDGSNELINCRCDYCGKEFKRMYYLITRSRRNGNVMDSCGDPECTWSRNKDTRMHKYNSISQVDICQLNGSNLGRKLKYTLDDFVNIFASRNLELVVNLIANKDSINVSEPLPFVCNMHKDMGVQHVSLDMLRQHKHCCKYGAIEAVVGENNCNWKGGIDADERHSYEYRKWRALVAERDNFKCQCCGLKNTDIQLHVHHILNFSEHEELKYDIDNGITLCENCHSPNIRGSFHFVYGTRNNTQEQLEEYLNKNKLRE